MKLKDKLDVIIPISLEQDWPKTENVIAEILEQNEKYGFTRFALAFPCGGWRNIKFTPTEVFEKKAREFAIIKNELIKHNIECGWWITATIKSGRDDEFSPIIRSDGSESPFSNCPLDPAFRKRFSSNAALFASIAKPKFIILEDDYSLIASSTTLGCFCSHHLAEFSKRQGKEYTRDSLLKELRAPDSPEKAKLLSDWLELMKDSLVLFAEDMRAAIDIKNPEIPIGLMQSGHADREGDATVPVSKALAGKNHTPFTRFFGVSYGEIRPEKIPCELYHCIYDKQHIEVDYLFYHESDTYPHTRFFTAACEMKSLMGAVYSHGFDGSTFQTQQLLDNANEETAYGEMYNSERARFNTVHRFAKQCEAKGVELNYDPSFNRLDKVCYPPLWTEAISLYSIPWTTKESSVAFIDKNHAANWDDKKIKEYLKKTLFIEGDGAKILCDRGYAEYLGVNVTEDDSVYEAVRYDLAAREVIRDEHLKGLKGKNIPSTYMFAISNGKMHKMTVNNPSCEIISEMMTFEKNVVNVGMSRFKNKLGGNIYVMSMTLDGNYSQSLLNYRRQHIIQSALSEHNDEFAFVKDDARIYTIMNEPTDKQNASFIGMLTLINLCGDTRVGLNLHLPESWKGSVPSFISRSGDLVPLAYSPTDDGIRLDVPFSYLDPAYIIFN